MSFWEQMSKAIDQDEEKKKEQKKKEELYQQTFHELAEKLNELRDGKKEK